MIKSVTFDVARTLMGISHQTDWKLVSDYLVEQGIELYPQELKASREYVFMVDLPKYRIDNWHDWTRQILARLGHTKVDQKTIEEMTSLISRATDAYYLYEDVVESFENLAEFELTHSALTTIPEFKLHRVMSPIRHYLSHIIHGGNAGCVKGNPRMYELDLKWKDIEPSANLFVGDHPYLDIELPQKMGQKTVHIRRAGIDAELDGSSTADFEITSLAELPEIIDRLVQ